MSVGRATRNGNQSLDLGTCWAWFGCNSVFSRLISRNPRFFSAAVPLDLGWSPASVHHTTLQRENKHHRTRPPSSCVMNMALTAMVLPSVLLLESATAFVQPPLLSSQSMKNMLIEPQFPHQRQARSTRTTTSMAANPAVDGGGGLPRVLWYVLSFVFKKKNIELKHDCCRLQMCGLWKLHHTEYEASKALYAEYLTLSTCSRVCDGFGASSTEIGGGGGVAVSFDGSRRGRSPA